MFEWVQRKDGTGLKRGPVKVRVKGLAAHSSLIFARAREIAEELDAGTYTGPRCVRVAS